MEIIKGNKKKTILIIIKTLFTLVLTRTHVIWEVPTTSVFWATQRQVHSKFTDICGHQVETQCYY